MRCFRSPRAWAPLAALVLSITSLSVAARAQEPPAAPTPAQLTEARTHMEAGAAFYNDPSGHKCEEAYREFRQAYDLSGSQNALKGMGTCALELERDGDAIEHYERYLEKATNVAPADRAQIENDMKALKAGVAWVTILADRPNVAIADVRTPSRGFSVTNRYTAKDGATKLGLHPGEHKLTASVEGQPDQVWKVEIANGQAYSHSFSFAVAKGPPIVAPVPPVATPETKAPPPVQDEPKTEKYRPTPVATWIFGGLTVALAVPTAILMVRAKGVNNDYKSVNGTMTGEELNAQYRDVNSANLLADIFLGAASASLITTGIIYLARPTRTREKVGHTFTVVPSFGAQSSGATAVGTF